MILEELERDLSLKQLSDDDVALIKQAVLQMQNVKAAVKLLMESCVTSGEGCLPSALMEGLLKMLWQVRTGMPDWLNSGIFITGQILDLICRIYAGKEIQGNRSGYHNSDIYCISVYMDKCVS